MTQTWMIPVFAVGALLLLLYWRRRQGGVDPDQYRRRAIEAYRPETLPPSAGDDVKILHFIKSQAAALYQEDTFQQAAIDLWKISEEGDRPLLVMVMGEFNTGKSTFINAILGEDVLFTDGVPATAVVSLLRYGEKRRAVLHYTDGRQKEYDFAKLSDITAEGNDAKQGLRDKLEYVEIFLPNELLKEIQIIDTPGLNANKEGHTQRTTHFQDKADIVLWLFNAAKSPTRTELDAIRTLGDRLKPYAIVNRIDSIDEEEESIEEVLARIEKSLKENIQSLVGISLRWVGEAVAADDKKLMHKAGWPRFENFLQTRIMEKKSTLKRQSLLEKLHAFHYAFCKDLAQRQEDCRQQAGWFSNAAEERKKVESEIAAIERQYARVMSYSDQVEALSQTQREFCSSNIDNPLDPREPMQKNASILMNFVKDQIAAAEDLSKLVNKLSFLQQIQISGTERLETFQRTWQHYQGEIDGLERELNDLDEEKAEIATLQVEYDHSGLFGGEPIFDFSGRRERLDNRKAAFNEHIDRVKNLAARLWQRCRTHSEEILSIMAEMKRLSDEICQAAEVLYEEKQRSIQEFATNFEAKKAEHDKACANVDFGKKIAGEMRHFLKQISRDEREESEVCV